MHGCRYMILKIQICLLLFILVAFSQCHGQDMPDTTRKNPNLDYVVQMFDGNVYVGKVIYEDPRAIQLQVKKMGNIYLKKNDIEVMRPTNKQELVALSNYTPSEVYSTKYFFTSNDLPVKKKEDLNLWNWYGIDKSFALSSRFVLDINTTWGGIPLLGTIRYDIQIGKKTSIGVGTLFGWGTWAFPNYTASIPYASITYGDRITNATAGAGYGFFSLYGSPFQSQVYTLAAMKKAGRRSSLVFESLFLPAPTNGSSSIALFIPGIRLQSEYKSAFQLGFGVMIVDGDFVPAPLPFVQWFRII